MRYLRDGSELWYVYEVMAIEWINGPDLFAVQSIGRVCFTEKQISRVLYKV